ncbi:SGNH/GDSL hydrolase family protein [Variovorax sp. M-6]|uniref:SGNH/GDSL hydrolase family protein n=1 Tax=Variovorax sp. M-6 TaxID=3233041 RepID=UPI003F95700F
MDLSIDSPAAPAGAISLAVLGDSNSHSYQDRIAFPPGSAERGGTRRSNTFQWTEVLERLRGREVDLGLWGRWGRRPVVAWARGWLGLEGGRTPKKEDYLFNFAKSGATCFDLLSGRVRQAQHLVELMDREPERWTRGVVVIRIGLNNWSGLLDLQARDPNAPELRDATAYCAGEIDRTVALIHAAHPLTRILVVGIGNEADDPLQADKWQSATESANINAALDAFNAALRQVATGRTNVAFFDDLAWFRALWGGRGESGMPDFKTVAIGPKLRVTHTLGDDPGNALLADDHPGVVWSTLWAQSLVARLNEAFGLALTPISDAEVVRFLEPLTGPPKAPGS